MIIMMLTMMVKVVKKNVVVKKRGCHDFDEIKLMIKKILKEEMVMKNKIIMEMVVMISCR